MSAPQRLTDDPKAPARLRSDLGEVARTEARPFDAPRGLERLRAALAPLPTPPAPLPPGLGPTFWGLTGIGTALAVGAVVAAGSFLAAGEPTPRAARTAVEVELRAEAPPPALPPPAIAPAASVPGERIVAAALREPARSSSIRRAARPPEPAGDPDAELRSTSIRRAARPQEPAGDPDAELRLEMAQLARIRALLPTDPAQALQMAQEGQRRFPSGMFREERNGLAVLALARLGRRVEARTRGNAYLLRHPRGPFSAEIRRLVARP
jgi:hypothetical protein